MQWPILQGKNIIVVHERICNHLINTLPSPSSHFVSNNSNVCCAGCIFPLLAPAFFSVSTLFRSIACIFPFIISTRNTTSSWRGDNQSIEPRSSLTILILQSCFVATAITDSFYNQSISTTHYVSMECVRSKIQPYLESFNQFDIECSSKGLDSLFVLSPFTRMFQLHLHYNSHRFILQSWLYPTHYSPYTLGL